MLRPATPLSICFLAAFVLLLISTLSTPIIESLPLASFEGINYGVLGACKGDNECTGIRVGYAPENLFQTNSDDDFTLPSSTRHSLSAILIVHAVASLLAFVCFVLSVSAHFRSPAHSPRYLLALLILVFPTLLLALLAFLVDILLFAPHMKVGAWVVLAAVVIIAACGILTCAMRRTLVSRKAQRKLIEDNPDMNMALYKTSAASDASKEGAYTTGFVTMGEKADDGERYEEAELPPTLTATASNAPSVDLPKDFGAAPSLPPIPTAGPQYSMSRPSQESQHSSRSRGGYGPRGAYGHGPGPPVYGRGGPALYNGSPRGAPMRGGYRGGPPSRGRGGPMMGPPRPPQYGPGPSQMPPAYGMDVPEMDGSNVARQARQGHNRSASRESVYYEDVPPQFDTTSPGVPGGATPGRAGAYGSLTRPPAPPINTQYLRPNYRPPGSQPYDHDGREGGSRSPTSSNGSHGSQLTSISRRAQPRPQGPPQMDLTSMDMFALPGGRGGRGGMRGRGRMY